MDQLIVRPLRSADVPACFELIDRERARIANFFPTTTTRCQDERSCAAYVRELEQQAIAGGSFAYLLHVEGQDAPVGMVMLKSFDTSVRKCEVSYFVAAKWERKGIATGALAWAVDEAFRKHDMHKVFLRIDPENTASIHVAEKNGFVREGLLRRDFRTNDGRLLDVLYYGKLR